MPVLPSSGLSRHPALAVSDDGAMSTTITAADAAEFLALVPRLAGFQPVRSVVVLPFRRDRSLGVMRVDLPGEDDDVDRIAATLVGMVCKVRDADGVAIVVYSDHPFAGSGADGGAVAHASLVRALEEKADACGLRVTEALCVAADGWGPYAGDGAASAPRPLSDLEVGNALSARLPAELRAPLGDQCAGAGLPGKDLAQTERTGRALRALDVTIGAVSRATGSPGAARADLAELDPQALAAVCALDDLPVLFEDALSWNPAALSPFEAAALSWCLERPALRDVALVQWCAGIDLGEAALEAQVGWDDGEEYPADIAAHLWGDAPRPDVGRLEAALELVRHVAALAPRCSRAGALCAAAWLCWALGRSTHAGWYAQEAVAIEPDHGLGGILLTMLAAGHLPEWAFERPLRSGR